MSQKAIRLHTRLGFKQLTENNAMWYVCCLHHREVNFRQNACFFYTIAMDTMDCESQIKICTRKCNRLYKIVRRSCKETLNRRPVCLQSCTAAVKDLLENKDGNTIWHCENPKGRLRKLRNAYSKIC